MSVAVDLAKAIEQALSTQGFSRPVKVVRTFDLKTEAERLTEDRILIVYGKRAIEPCSRAESMHTYMIDIAIQGQCEVTETDKVDALTDLVEEVLDFLNRKPMAGLPWVGAQPRVEWAPDHLVKGVFLSVHQVRYKALR